MKLLTYDQVDPLGVLHLNLLCLGYPLTPELAARLRRHDPRVMERARRLVRLVDGAVESDVRR